MTLELAVDSVAAAQAALAFADRLELCAGLETHGRTPAPELIVAVRALIDAARGFDGAPELVVLVRPTPSLVADGEMLERMVDDVHASIAAGADAVAVGVLDAGGEVDVAACRRLASAAGSRPLVFHRAFDFTPNPEESIGHLADLGFSRVLTAGAPVLDVAGVSLDERLGRIRGIGRAVHRAGHRIVLVACGGIRAANAHRFLAVASELHSAARTPADSGAAAFDPGEAGAIRAIERASAAARSRGPAEG